MSGIFTSIFLISLLLGGILLFFRLCTTRQGNPISKNLILPGALLFMVYVVCQTIIHMYSLHEWDLAIVLFCESFFALFGFLFILFVVTKNRSDQRVEDSRSSGIIVGLIAVYFSGLFLPSYIASKVETYCSEEAQRSAEVVISAVRKYASVEGKFPDGLRPLFPVYLKEIPSPTCLSTYSPFIPALTSTAFLRKMKYSVMMDLIKLKKLDYSFRQCEWNDEGVREVELYLIVPTVDLAGKLRYDFALDSWQRIPYYHDECMPFRVDD